MDRDEKRIRELIADLNAFCFDHEVTGEDCEKCPFYKYEVCPLNEFYMKCLLAIYNNWTSLKRSDDL